MAGKVEKTMLSNYILNRLTAEKAVPQVDKKKCLHRRNFLPCQACAHACPSGAIMFEESAGKTAPVFSDRCVNCGICAANCPARCITLPRVKWKEIFNQAAARAPLILSCSESGRFQGMEEPLPCAGALTGEFIAALCVARQFSPFAIDVSRCAACLPRATWSLFRSLRKARTMLASQKLPITLLLQAEQETPCSRREAFSYLGHRLHQLAEDLLDRRISHQESIHRALLLKTLAQHPGIEVLLDSWEVNDACRGCGRCQNLCPQKAWVVQRNQDAVILFHDMIQCFGCKLCFTACPHGAKEKIPVAYPDRANKMENGARHVRTFPAVRCRTCNRQVVQAAGGDPKDNRCMICQKRTALLPAGA